ncbi:MAG: bifunctional YncE family protein/alkaline phosphatase family protein [Janthinobacterium lividum]
MFKLKFPGLFVAFFGLMLAACHPPQNKKNAATEEQNMHFSYDDSTLTNRILPVMMPYNRLIDPAGKVISFGSPDLENHSMDVKLISQSSEIVVEDRYGIAVIDTTTQKVIGRWTYSDDPKLAGLMSTYSGLKVCKINGVNQVFWSAAVSNGSKSRSCVLQASWENGKLKIENVLDFKPGSPSPLALPNEVFINPENSENFLYVVLNGNNQLVKINLKNSKTIWTKPTGVAPYGITIVQNKIFVSNWAGPLPTDTTRETAGVPYGKTYTDPKTGATASGTVSVFEPETGKMVKEINVGLHPNAIINSSDGKFIYVANGNSDKVSVISVENLQVAGEIAVKLIPGKNSFIGDTPNALALSGDGKVLFVANGLDNAVAMIKLGVKTASNGSGSSEVMGFVPTEAYPGGLLVDGQTLFVTNLEGEGSRVSSNEMGAGSRAEIPTSAIPSATKPAVKVAAGAIPAGKSVVGSVAANPIPTAAGEAFNTHHQKATVSIIQIPDNQQLNQYTKRVKALNLTFRQEIARLLPRKNIAPKPMPERIGEPSVFKHVLYIIKENRTYDQVLGDMPEGNGQPSLCIFGDQVTPNQHSLARNFLLLDNYYASGKCSAEGHQWTDAAMVTDYVEKSVRAWFRSYPHVQEDALVYDSNGFIWNNAADHGKTVRIYGEACQPHLDNKLNWMDIYENYKAGKPFKFYNTSTISRVRPMLSQSYPGSDDHRVNEQLRAKAFINELKEYEKKPGDQLPNLMVMALSSDHTVGTRPGFPTPTAMVADNDLALGKIIEAVTKSRFWKNTVVFVTEDDSQAGWDHVSAYRTTGFVVSPYSVFKHKISTNYNQVSMVRSIEQILGIPPMNVMDATALPMFKCFTGKPSTQTYQSLANQVPIDQINPKLASLKGAALHFAKLSLRPEYDHIDGGNDNVMNRIIWFSAKGKKTYPANLAGHDTDD